MTRDDIIRMAREAGFADGVVEIVGLEGFARFAALVAAAEREACAELSREILEQCEGYDFGVPASIRARGQA
jgi:hypothetical protein